MLQQILDQMFVDPELLADLTKEQVRKKPCGSGALAWHWRLCGVLSLLLTEAAFFVYVFFWGVCGFFFFFLAVPCFANDLLAGDACQKCVCSH